MQKPIIHMMFKDVRPMSIIRVGGLNYIKMGDSHSVGCRDGKDHIFALNNKVQVVGRARACAI